MAVNPSSRFDPNLFPQLKSSGQGSENGPTDYKAARILEEFLNQYKPEGMFRGDIDWAIRQGEITDSNGETIELTEEQKAAFQKLAANNYSLFNRLDAGTNGERDQRVTTENVNDAIKSSWKLHGAEKSEEGHWSDPGKSMPKSEAKKILTEYFGKNGTMQRSVLEGIVSRKFQSDFEPNINDPKVVQATAVLLDDLDNVNKGGITLAKDEDWITLEEIMEWDVD